MYPVKRICWYHLHQRLSIMLLDPLKTLEFYNGMAESTNIIQIDGESFLLSDLLGFLVLEKGLDIASLAKAFVSIRHLAKSRGAITDNINVDDLLAEWRQDAGLEKASDMKSWMREMGVTDNALRMFCIYMATEGALTETITEDEISEYHDTGVSTDDIRDIYVIYFDDLSIAKKCHEELLVSPDTFMPMARAQSNEPFSRVQGGYVGRMTKDDLPVEMAESLFAIDPGDIVGPIATDNGAVICTSHRVPESELSTDDNIETVEELIESWLEREAYKRVVERTYLLT